MLDNSDTIQRGFTAIPPRFHRVPTTFPPRFHARTPAVLATVPERVSRSKKLTSAWKHAGRGRCVDFHANQFRGDAWKKFLPRELYCTLDVCFKSYIRKVGGANSLVAMATRLKIFKN